MNRRKLKNGENFQLTFKLACASRRGLHVVGIVPAKKAGRKRHKSIHHQPKDKAPGTQLVLFGELQQNQNIDIQVKKAAMKPQALYWERDFVPHQESGNDSNSIETDRRLQQIAEILLSAIYRYIQKSQHNSIDLTTRCKTKT